MTSAARGSAIALLRSFARAPSSATGTSERCDGCGVAIPSRHEHLVSAGALELSCACLACFASPPPSFKIVPRRVERLDVAATVRVLNRLGLPVGLGFVVAASATEPRWIARFPGVAGATLAELPGDADAVLRELLPVGLAPDVEALLFDRARGAAFVVSIDRCFELTGLLRARQDADVFFVALEAEARA